MGDNVNIVSVKEDPKIANKEIETKLPSDSATTRKNMKEEKARKKDDRSVEQVLKALNSLETTEEKLAAMCKKYADTVDDNRKLQLSLKQTEKRLVVLQREKEQLQTEHSKAVLTRSRLESLCRELQRQNKAVKDESLLKIREEEEKRKEVSAKFQSTLADVTALMQQNNEKNCKLREDNLEMTKKFKSVCEQYELREQQVEKISKQLQLESQLADARLSKAKMEMAAEKEALLREKQQLLMEVVECQAKIQDLQATETSLRNQISLYTNKYDEFQNALSRSNDVFEGFKGEMEKMSKKICKLEKETSSWKQRWEKSHQALLEMAADKQQRDSELQLTTRQLAQLQKLCRTLQAERTSLLAQLKTSGKSSGVEGGVSDTAEKGQGDEKNTCHLPSLESALSESAQGAVTKTAPPMPSTLAIQLQEGLESISPEETAQLVQEDVCLLKSLAELALEVVPKTNKQESGVVNVLHAFQQDVPEAVPVMLETATVNIPSKLTSPDIVETNQPESPSSPKLPAESNQPVLLAKPLSLENSLTELASTPVLPAVKETDQQKAPEILSVPETNPTTPVAPAVIELESTAVNVPSENTSLEPVVVQSTQPSVSETATVMSVGSENLSPANKSKESVTFSKKSKEVGKKRKK